MDFQNNFDVAVRRWLNVFSTWVCPLGLADKFGKLHSSPERHGGHLEYLM